VRTLSTIAAAVLVLVLVVVAALAIRAGSMRPAAVAEEWEDFREKTVRPIREHGLLRPWAPTDEERMDEAAVMDGPARSPTRAPSK